MPRISAKFDRALALRRSGAGYADILREVRVAKSTLWRWLKAEGLVETQPQRLTELRRAAQRKGAAAVRAKHLAETDAILERARRDVDRINVRELWLIGIALYWAEGTKQKPHNPTQRVVFTNSDPAMLRVFLRWITESCRIAAERLTFEICIHESGDIDTAKKFWAMTLHIPAEQFRIRFKRHRVSPHRRNIGRSYVGLVRIIVQRSAALNRAIRGWTEGIVQGIGESAKGKPGDFGSPYPGSSPGSPVYLGESQVQDHDDTNGYLALEGIQPMRVA